MSKGSVKIAGSRWVEQGTSALETRRTQKSLDVIENDQVEGNGANPKKPGSKLGPDIKEHSSSVSTRRWKRT